MKKLLLIMGLNLALFTVKAQAFMPEPGVLYNIKQVSSGLVIGPTLVGGISSTQPAVLNLTNKKSQAFEFIPVADKTDTYYLLNGEGMYLNKLSGVDWDYWTSIFESVTNVLNSEWTIEGDNENGFRLKQGASGNYLASDNITSGSALYVDKGVDNTNGLFKAQIATIDDKPTFLLLEKGLVVEVEKENYYPIRVFAKDHTYDINVEIPNGFFIEKNKYTPADFSANSGNIRVELFALEDAVVGETGKVIFSYERSGNTNYIDTIEVRAVDTYDRYYIKHKTSNLVIGNKSDNEKHPALTEINTSYEEGGYQQNVILRKVNPDLNDSLFYIVQDGTYNMLRKDPTSGWNTEWGYYSPEAKWKIFKREDGIWEIINSITNKWLGADDILADSRLYADKAFVANATAKPYSEWIVIPATEMFDPTSSTISSVNTSAGLLNPAFDPTVTSYQVLLPVDVTEISINAKAQSLSAYIDNNDAVLGPNSPTTTISCISEDNQSTTNYSFEYKAMGFDWDARGETVASRSVPSQWGWKCPNATWVGANATTSGSVRYIDNPTGYYFIGDTLNTGVLADTVKYTGRILYLRWDGSVTTSGIYSYPVMLTEGKNYNFKGKYAWNSVIPEGVTTAKLTIGFNSLADNSGTIISSNEYIVESTKLQQLFDAEFSFSVPSTGIYYLTFMSDATILGAVANMQIEGLNTSIPNTNNSHLKLWSYSDKVVISGTESGDAITIYNAAGQIVKRSNAIGNQSEFTLSQGGVYMIKVNNQILRIIR